MALRFRPMLWPTVFSLAGVLILVWLGTWQLERLAWKTDLIDRIEGGLAADPLPLAVLLADEPDAAAHAWRRVSVQGTYDHAGEQLVYSGTGPQGPGALVMTPLESPGLPPVLVNRGYVPETRQTPASRPDSQPDGEVEIVGFLRPAGPPGPFVPPHQPGGLWFVRDVAGMAEATGHPDLLLVTLELTAERPSADLPVPQPAEVRLTNNHLGYALTWYGLAIALLSVYGAFHHRAGRLTIDRA